jgi:hypothetical protein
VSATNHSANLTTILSLTEGDRIVLTFDGAKGVTRREVTVTGTKQVDGKLRYVWTTSGRTRPGHIAGGSITVYPDVIRFQPTMQQQAGTLLTIEKVEMHVVH